MKKVETSFDNEIAYIREGHGVPLILIHGLDSNMASYYSLKDELKTIFEVIIYDVRGHGKSTKHESFDINDHVKDLYSLMEKLNIEAAHIVGHDMGGLIAKHFTNQFDSKVLSLTLVATNLFDSVGGLNKLMIDHQDEIEGFDKSEALIILFPYIYQEQLKARKWLQDQRIYSRQTSEDSAIATRALMNFPLLSQNEVIETVNVPTLMIYGKHDPLVDLDNLNQESIAGDELTVYTFEHSGHAPHIEETENFIQKYLEFTNQGVVE